MGKENTGYIRLLPDGRWKAIVEYPPINGKRYRKSRTCSTEAKAKKALLELNMIKQETSNNDEIKKTSTLPFKVAVEAFKTKIAVKVSVGHLKKRTQLSYNQLADKLCSVFGSYDCSEITSKVFEDYLDKLLYKDKLSFSTVSKLKIVLVLVFKENKLPVGDFKEIHIPHKRNLSHIKPLSEKEQALLDDYIKTTLTQYIGSKNKQWLILFLYYFGLYTGCRCGEVAGLKWSSIQENEGVIIIENNLIYIPGEGLLDDSPKTQESTRRLVVSDSVFQLLRRLKKVYEEHDYPESEYCFITREGKPIFPRNILRDFQKMCQKAGIVKHHTFHDLRHTNITTKIIKGVDVKTVSLMAGHSDTSVTLNTYSHYWKEAAQRAANIFSKEVLPF